MKTLLFLAAIFASFASSTRGQLQLNPGDSFSFSFNNLPKTGVVSVFGSTPGGTLQVTVNSGSFQSGDQLRLEMFESALTDPPICSTIMNSAPPYNPSCTTDFAWQDQQGAIRLTMLSGSTIVDNISIKAIVSGPSLSSYDVYSLNFTPVPEPGTVALLMAAGFVFLIARAVHRRMTTSS
jgi:hypothetical protein